MWAVEKDVKSMRWLCWDERNRWEWFEEFAGSIRDGHQQGEMNAKALKASKTSKTSKGPKVPKASKASKAP